MKQRGFTLIEILIALLIFSILMTMITSALVNVYTAQVHLSEHDKQFSQVQKAMLIMERDCEQIINRPFINNVNRPENALEYRFNQGKPILMFTRAGMVIPVLAEGRSQLQRVSYYLRGQQLMRRTWLYLDNQRSNPTTDQILLDGVDQLSWRFIDAHHRQYGLWPPVQSMSSQIPQGIQVQFRLQNGGIINRTFLIAERTLAYSHRTKP